MIYDILYDTALYVCVALIRLAARFHKKARRLVKGQDATWAALRQGIKSADRVVWFHAASLGEFEQGRPLIERLRREQSGVKILLTFFSPSGYEVRRDYRGADVVCYLPFDTPTAARRFMRLAHPEVGIIIKYEFWQNYCVQARRAGVRLYSVSSIFRAGQHFFRWWGSQKVLRQFDHFFVQNDTSYALLHHLARLDNVTVVGDTRFDRVIDVCEAARPLPVVEAFAAGAGRVFIAGSSWEADEDIYMPYFAAHRGWRLVIAPHKIGEEHLGRIESQAAAAGLKSVRFTDVSSRGQAAAADVLIINCFGLLSSVYRYATVALVGGGFGAGIHNVPEAAVYGVPVVVGPNNRKFREARALIDSGGAFEVTDQGTFAAVMDRLTGSPEALAAAGACAGRYIRSHAGATAACYRAIFGRGQK